MKEKKWTMDLILYGFALSTLSNHVDIASLVDERLWWKNSEKSYVIRNHVGLRHFFPKIMTEIETYQAMPVRDYLVVGPAQNVERWYPVSRGVAPSTCESARLIKTRIEKKDSGDQFYVLSTSRHSKRLSYRGLPTNVSAKRGRHYMIKPRYWMFRY